MGIRMGGALKRGSVFIQHWEEVLIDDNDDEELYLFNYVEE